MIITVQTVKLELFGKFLVLIVLLAFSSQSTYRYRTNIREVSARSAKRHIAGHTVETVLRRCWFLEVRCRVELVQDVMCLII